MKPLKCGTCTTCCEWETDISIRPVLTFNEGSKYKRIPLDGEMVLAAQPNGDCVYLIDGMCVIYDHRPAQCRSFDCRELYNQMKDSTFIKVILAGKRKLK